MSYAPACHDMNEDLQILQQLKTYKLRGVRFLITRYGDGMIIVAFRMLGDMEKAKKIVYETFWKLWRENGFLDAKPPLRAFLYEAIKKACLATDL